MFVLVFLIFLSAGLVSILMTTNPALLVVWLILLTIGLGFVLNSITGPWMMYATILLFTGGMMVLFTYVATLAFSLKITFSSPSSIFLAIWMVLMTISISHFYQSSFQMLISSLYFKMSSYFLIMIGGYLFLTLLVVVKLVTKQEGPLKSFFKKNEN